MKVLIRGEIIDPEKEPIVIIMNDSNKSIINNMPIDKDKYICCPFGYDLTDIHKQIEKL